MQVLVDYLSEGHSFIELIGAIVVIVALVIGAEKFFKWLYDLFIKLYNKKKGKEDDATILGKNTKDIKELSVNIENLATLLNKQYQHLNKKIDEQNERLETTDKEGKRRDITLFRDRLIQGIRYFSQNKDGDDIIHISMADYENLNSMFEEYFRAGGNGVILHIYETEFQKFKIDNDSFVR